MSDGFLGRWSRRKQQVREGETPPEPQLPPAAAAASAAAAAEPVPAAPAAVPLPVVEPEAEAAPPTLADAESLTIDSDFKPFVARNVAPEVKNAAFKKLFADPHFNVMDGLDTYIDDYSTPSPLPLSVLRQMASAKFLNLFDDEEEAPEETPRNAAPPDVAQSKTSEDIPSPPVAEPQPASQETDDHHADLRLQPDDAARAEDARRRAG